MNLGGTVKLNRRGWALVGVACALIALVHFGWVGVPGGDAKSLEAHAVLAGAVRAALVGGDAVVAAHRSPVRKKSGGEPVTVADQASHCRMVAALAEDLPEVIVASEETNECGGEAAPPKLDASIRHSLPQLDGHVEPAKLVVWIDPLDATQEYTEDLRQYVTTMVCVAVDGVPTVGVIYKPFTRELYWAWVSKAHSENLDSSKHVERPATVIVSRSHKGDVESFIKNTLGSNYDVKPAGGAGYKVLEVVHGNADVYIHTTSIKKWDICSGNAILNALGGRMTSLNNETIDYSRNGDAVNKHGLLSALKNHNVYMEKMNPSNS